MVEDRLHEDVSQILPPLRIAAAIVEALVHAVEGLEGNVVIVVAAGAGGEEAEGGAANLVLRKVGERGDRAEVSDDRLQP